MVADDRIRETNLPLLQDVQAYLKARLEDKMPDSVLVLAWEEFYGLYETLIRRFVIAQGVPSSDVDDCVQEVWSDVAARLVEFDRPSNRPGLRAWFYAVVRNKSVDVFRRRNRRPADSLDQAMADGKEPADTGTDPAALYQKKWERAVLESVILRLRDELSTTNYRILCMRALEHRTTKDVAAELNLTSEQVRYRLHRMMKKLRTYLTVAIGKPIETQSNTSNFR